MLSRETQHASAALDSTPKHDDLVFDVGMHRGEDAEFYLRKGFRVVGFEANPYLANYCREQYRVWIDRGLLTIVEGAIVEPNAIESDRRTLSFYINWENSAWGTTNSDWAERNQRLGTDSSRIEVEAVDFTEALRTHGIPHYLKVDIEGNDAVCLRALKQFAARPDYVSIESDKTSYWKIRKEILLLCELGYDRFQAVEQSLLPLKQSPPRPPREGLDAEWTFPEGASGLFGAELPDAWKSRREILSLYRYIRLGYFLLGDDGILNGLDFYQADDLRDWVAEFLGKRTRQCVPGWYDTHARHAGAAVSSLAGEAFAWRFPRDFPENDSSADEGESGAERLLPYRAGNRVAA